MDINIKIMNVPKNLWGFNSCKIITFNRCKKHEENSEIIGTATNIFRLSSKTNKEKFRNYDRSAINTV